MFKTGSYPEMIDLFRQLKKRNKLKTAAVSNEGRELTIHRIGENRLIDFIDFLSALVSSILESRMKISTV